MRPLFTILCMMAAIAAPSLAPALQLVGGAPPTENEAPLSAPVLRQHSSWTELLAGETFRIDFPVPMVDAGAVGQTASPDVLKTNFDSRLHVIWISASQLQVAVAEDLPVLDVLRLEIPALQGPDGRIVPAFSCVLPTRGGSICPVRCQDDEEESAKADDGLVLFGCWEPDYDDAVRRALPSMYFEVAGKRFPAEARPATTADALAHWNSFDAVTGYEADSHDRDAMAELPGDQVLPHVWVAKKPGAAAPGELLKLVLPGFAYSQEKECYVDGEIMSWSSPHMGYHLSSKVVGEGVYRVSLRFDLSAKETDAAALVRSLKWKVREDAHSDTFTPLVWKEGALVGVVRGRQVKLTPEGEPVKVLSHVASTGQEVEGSVSLNLLAETGGLELRLVAEGGYEPILPDEPEAELGDATMLQPKMPYIYTDLALDGLRAGGGAVIRCRYGELRSGQARVWKLDGAPEHAVRLLRQFRELYLQCGEDEEATADAEEASGRKRKLPLVPTDSLPGVEALAERSLEAPQGRLELDLAALFPDKPLPGFYFVEARGNSFRKGKEAWPVANQALLQVTDLGLVWKINGERLFAHAWRLADGKPVLKARLMMLDDDGKPLGELGVEKGRAEGAYDPAARYLQLRTEDDCLTLAMSRSDLWQESTGDWDVSRLVMSGLNPAQAPRGEIFLFSDRNVYRPGETAHVKGMARMLTGNSLSMPGIESVSAEVCRSDGSLEEVAVKVEDDGGFSVDAPVGDVAGPAVVSFKIKYQGDDALESPDLAFFSRCGWKPDGEGGQRCERDRCFDRWAQESRQARLDVRVAEFRRNEFEVSSEIKADSESGQVEVSTHAVNLTSTPVAYGKVLWDVCAQQGNFYPKGWEEFRFGDFRENPWSYFIACFHGGGEERLFDDPSGRSYASRAGALDGDGRGSAVFALSRPLFPRRTLVTVTSTVTNGNGQSIRSVRKTTLDPAAVYAGIRAEGRLLKAGDAWKAEVVAVKPDGSAWDGAPIEAELTAVRKVYRPYRYGARALSAVRNVEEEERTIRKPVSLSGRPSSVEMELPLPGTWDVYIKGEDAEGRPFCSATRHYVWGNGVSPWERLNGERLELTADKDWYEPGEAARILVQTPVDAELLVTVERDGVLRSFTRQARVDDPVIEVPLEAADAPYVHVGVFLVQGAGGRAGMPLLKSGGTELFVASPDKKLAVSLQTPERGLLPGEDCTISGVVTGADGRPVPDAHVTLFAEDEGVLQVSGYAAPDPLRRFYGERMHNVLTLSSLFQLAPGRAARRDFGNKGVFIGGGGDDDCIEAESGEGVSDEVAARLRSDFTPCALWLSDVRTDAQGCFKAVYKNPDTLTRYRLMAVISAGADRFGSGVAAYHVTKPVMLEPAAPMSATAGDVLQTPVTVSMLPQELGADAPAAVSWRVRLSGVNAVIPEPEQTVELTGDKPVTLFFPVHVGEGGKVSLTWDARPVRLWPGADVGRLTDAVRLEFPVSPPAPHLGERVHVRLAPGGSGDLRQWLRTPFRADTPVELTFSTNPLAGMRYGLRSLFAYPYGCTEQISSKLAPWLFREELTESLGMDYPKTKDPGAIVSDALRRLRSRNLDPGRDKGRYGYWDGDSEPSAFSTYVVLIRDLAYETGKLPESEIPLLEREIDALRKQLLHDVSRDLGAAAGNILKYRTNAALKRPDMLAAWLLARRGALEEEEIAALRRQLASPYMGAAQPQELWMLALCARLAEHPQADRMREEARAAEARESEASEVGNLPPLEAIRALDAVAEDPDSEQTARLLQQCLESMMERNSTWSNAWLAITVHQYLRVACPETRSASVNGLPLDSRRPLRLELSAGDGRSFSASGDTVYVSGYAEGYLTEEQPLQAVDKGFAVQRRYEALQPDGSWKPVGVFRVGDIVRVTVTARPTMPRRNGYQHIALEDRLPAAFEAIDPALESQALPEGIDAAGDRRGWFSPFNHVEYLKDRVRFFADSPGYGSELQAAYAARVVRSGRVTAPAAKAELMYRPQVHGLSIPQSFDVQPRP